MRQQQVQRRRVDREERTARRYADHGQCTGPHIVPEPATDGQLCRRHFLEAIQRRR